MLFKTFCSRAEGSQAIPPLWEPGWEMQTAAVYFPRFIKNFVNFQVWSWTTLEKITGNSRPLLDLTVYSSKRAGITTDFVYLLEIWWKPPTVGGITTICFKSGFKSLRMHTQGYQGCQKIRNFVRNTKILIARSTIQPKLSKIKKTVRNA